VVVRDLVLLWMTRQLVVSSSDASIL